LNDDKTVNPFVGGSSPPRGAKSINQDILGCLFLCLKSIDIAVYTTNHSFCRSVTFRDILSISEYNCEYKGNFYADKY
jgi:hypothetical protein